MLMDVDFETACAKVTAMSKSEVTWQLLHFNGPLHLDFTAEYLNTLDVDKLRHILLAALITSRRKEISCPRN